MTTVRLAARFASKRLHQLGVGGTQSPFVRLLRPRWIDRRRAFRLSGPVSIRGSVGQLEGRIGQMLLTFGCTSPR